MFVTKKSLSRRTFLRGVGAAAGAAAARFDGRRRSRRWRNPATPAASERSSCRSANGPATGRRKRPATNFEFSPILKPLEPFRNSLTVVSELCDPLDGHAVTVAAWLSGSIPKRTIAEDVHAGTTIDQIVAQTDRPGHGLSVARTRDGRLHRLHRRLRSRVRLRLYEYPFVAHADRAAADGDQSARGVRTLFGRPGTAAQRLAQMQTDGSILDSHQGRRHRSGGGPGAERPEPSQRLSGECARDRTAHPARREAGDSGSESARTRPSAFPTLSRSMRRCSSTCWPSHTKRTSRASLLS